MDKLHPALRHFRCLQVCAFTSGLIGSESIEGYTFLELIEHTGTDAQCYIGYFYDRPLIAFRGTEPTKLRDLVTDMRAWKSEPPYAGMHDSEVRIHTGFITAYHSIRLELYRRLERMDLSTNGVWSVGHSMGGAIANIFGVDANYLFGIKADCITFGQPRIGNAAFVRSSYNRIGMVRYVNKNDVIASIPRLNFTPDIRAIQLGERSVFPFSIKDHLIESYLYSFETEILSPLQLSA